MTLLQKAIKCKGKFLRNFLTPLLLLLFSTAYAQTPATDDQAKKPITDGMKAEMAVQKAAADSSTNKAFSKKMSLGLNLGLTNGVGIDFAYSIMPHLNAKLGFNYADFAINDYRYTLAVKATDPAGTILVRPRCSCQSRSSQAIARLCFEASRGSPA